MSKRRKSLRAGAIFMASYFNDVAKLKSMKLRGIPLTPENLKSAKDFALRKWQERAAERGYRKPKDLSDACKFCSEFAANLFGGKTKGNYHHQFAVVNNYIVDLAENSKNVKDLKARGVDPYKHDPAFWGNPDHKESIKSIQPRIKKWRTQFAEEWLTKRNPVGTSWMSVDGHKNPTPKLKKIRALAHRWIAQYGWQVALNKATRMERDRNFRHGRLLRRVLYRIRDEEAIKPGPQQSPKIIKKKKVVRTTQAMYQRLLEEYGTTDPMYDRGFILEDGSCLNLGQYDDHRSINSVYADTDAAETRFGSRYGAFVNLCKKFNMIRWIPESKQAEVFVEPTRHQLSALRDLMDAGKLREVEVWHRGRNVVLEAEDSDTMIAGIEVIYGA